MQIEGKELVETKPPGQTDLLPCPNPPPLLHDGERNPRFCPKPSYRDGHRAGGSVVEPGPGTRSPVAGGIPSRGRAGGSRPVILAVDVPLSPSLPLGRQHKHVRNLACRCAPSSGSRTHWPALTPQPPGRLTLQLQQHGRRLRGALRGAGGRLLAPLHVVPPVQLPHGARIPLSPGADTGSASPSPAHVGSRTTAPDKTLPGCVLARPGTNGTLEGRGWKRG